MSDPRERYWNGRYLEYWESKVREANHGDGRPAGTQSDAPPPSDTIYSTLIDLLGLEAESRVLEMGCGFGRTIPILHRRTRHIDAIDISRRMVELATARFVDLCGVNFLHCEAERTPFESGRFHSVICFGVFDALYQTKALVEINRILRIGGLALITGKNDIYFADDEKAIAAERNAREKGHPNYFTDVQRLLPYLPRLGFRIVHQRFFLRRGDMALNMFTSALPDRFYEYAFIFEKLKPSESEVTGHEIASSVSKSFAELDRNKVQRVDLLRRQSANP